MSAYIDDQEPSRNSSARICFMSSHTSRFFSGDRSKYAGWNVAMTRIPSISKNFPRSLEIGAAVCSTVWAANVPRQHTIFGRMAASCFRRNGLHEATSSGSGLRFSGGPAFQNVANVDILALEVDGFDD